MDPEVEDGPGALQPQPLGDLACVDQLLPVGVERHRLVCSPVMVTVPAMLDAVTDG